MLRCECIYTCMWAADTRISSGLSLFGGTSHRSLPTIYTSVTRVSASRLSRSAVKHLYIKRRDLPTVNNPPHVSTPRLPVRASITLRMNVCNVRVSIRVPACRLIALAVMIFSKDGPKTTQPYKWLRRPKTTLPPRRVYGAV